MIKQKRRNYKKMHAEFSKGKRLHLQKKIGAVYKIREKRNETMTKDILLQISGTQRELQAPENEEVSGPIEVITAATYYQKNEKHYIMYEEVTEGFSEVTKNLIKISDDTIDITKRGVTNVHMVFERNKKNMTYYCTPYGNISMGIHAHEINIEEKEHEMRIDVNYGLELNYEHIADCTIQMVAQSKEHSTMHLS